MSNQQFERFRMRARRVTLPEDVRESVIDEMRVERGDRARGPRRAEGVDDAVREGVRVRLAAELRHPRSRGADGGDERAQVLLAQKRWGAAAHVGRPAALDEAERGRLGELRLKCAGVRGHERVCRGRGPRGEVAVRALARAEGYVQVEGRDHGASKIARHGRIS